MWTKPLPIIFCLSLVFGACKRNVSQSESLGYEYERVVACGNFTVSLVQADLRSFLNVSLRAQGQLEMHNAFDVGKDDAILTVAIREYDGDVGLILCNDAMPMDAPELVQEAVATSGTVQVELDEENYARYQEGEPYEVTLVLADVRWEDDEEGITQRIERVKVGWLPG